MSEPTNSNPFVNPDVSEDNDNDNVSTSNSAADVDNNSVGLASDNEVASQAAANNDANLTDEGSRDFSGDDRVDLGNHEADVVDEPPHVNDEGHLVDSSGKKVFTTTEEAIKDGSFVLDAKGRMPGLYLDDLEALQRRNQSEAVEKAFGAASEGKNSVVERQVNVANSGLPPVTVVTKQEHPLSGDAKDDNAEVPLLEKNPLPAE